MKVVLDDSVNDVLDSALNYTMSGNVLKFDYSEIQYSIDFVCEDVLKTCDRICLELETDSMSSCKEYALWMEFVLCGISNKFLYHFTSMDFVSNPLFEIKVYLENGVYRVELNMDTVGECYLTEDGIRNWDSRFYGFLYNLGLSEILPCFEFEVMDYITVEESICLRLLDGYLIVHNKEIFDSYNEFKETFVCYGCEYNGYQCYMFTEKTSDSEWLVEYDYRLVVRDNILVTTHSDLMIRFVSKRLM